MDNLKCIVKQLYLGEEITTGQQCDIVLLAMIYITCLTEMSDVSDSVMTWPRLHL